METKKASRVGNMIITVSVDMTELDAAIEKANRLVELLQEAQQIISSLNGESPPVNITNLADLMSKSIRDTISKRQTSM